MELAIATAVPVREWWTETDAVIATALEVLEDRKRQIENATKG